MDHRHDADNATQRSLTRSSKVTAGIKRIGSRLYWAWIDLRYRLLPAPKYDNQFDFDGLFEFLSGSKPPGIALVDWFSDMDYVIGNGDHVAFMFPPGQVLVHYPFIEEHHNRDDLATCWSDIVGLTPNSSSSDDAVTLDARESDVLVHAMRRSHGENLTAWHCRVFYGALTFTVLVTENEGVTKAISQLSALLPDAASHETQHSDNIISYPCVRLALYSCILLAPIEKRLRTAVGEQGYLQIVKRREQRSFHNGCSCHSS